MDEVHFCAQRSREGVKASVLPSPSGDFLFRKFLMSGPTLYIRGERTVGAPCALDVSMRATRPASIHS